MSVEIIGMITTQKQSETTVAQEPAIDRHLKRGLPLRWSATLLLGSLLLGSLLLPTVQAASASDAWPSRPLKLIVPFPPGGAADAVGRRYAEKLSDVLKQPIVIDNKPGAGSAIGGDIAARSAADGHPLSPAPAGQLTVCPTSRSHWPMTR